MKNKQTIGFVLAGLCLIGAIASFYALTTLPSGMGYNNAEHNLKQQIITSAMMGFTVAASLFPLMGTDKD